VKVKRFDEAARIDVAQARDAGTAETAGAIVENGQLSHAAPSYERSGIAP